MTVAVFIPMKANGSQNSREHWAAKAKRVKKERNWAWLITPKVELPCVVTLTRCGSRQLDDDNLRACLKAVRDGVADRLGVPDNDPRVQWRYDQAKCKRVDVGVRIELEKVA